MRALPATEARVGDPVALGVALGVGDRLGHDLQPPDLAGPPRHRQPDRADPAVEVEDALAAAQPRVLGGDRVEPLGHLGVGLEEGVVGHLEVAGRRAPREPLLAEHAGRPLGAAGVPSITVCRSTGGFGKRGRRGDEAGLDLAGAPPLADDEVAEHARRRARRS